MPSSAHRPPVEKTAADHSAALHELLVRRVRSEDRVRDEFRHEQRDAGVLHHERRSAADRFR